MRVDLNSVIATVLGITAFGLLLSNATAFNSIISSGGGFITTNLALLQGRQISGGLFGQSYGRLGN